MGKFISTLFASLSGAARAIVSFLLPILKSDAGKLIAVALPIAQGIVTDLAAGKLPSGDKRELAVTKLHSALVSQGYATAAEIASSTLNLVVEMAVSRLKI